MFVNFKANKAPLPAANLKAGISSCTPVALPGGAQAATPRGWGPIDNPLEPAPPLGHPGN